MRIDVIIDIRYDVYTCQEPYDRFVGSYNCKCAAEAVMLRLNDKYNLESYFKINIKEEVI